MDIVNSIKNDLKEKTLCEIVNKMIELASINSRIFEPDYNGFDKEIYKFYIDEINRRERYFKKGASVMLPEHLHLK